MEKIFECSLHNINGKKGCALVTEFADKKTVIVPLLMISIVEGIRSGNEDIVYLFEILKSVVESVEMNTDINYNVSERKFNGKDRL